MKKLKIFLVAGEPSGDYLGAQLIKALKKQHQGNLVLKGVGGSLMKKEGVSADFSLMDIATIGIVEVVSVAFKAIKLLKLTSEAIRKFQPDILITIDVPGFSFRLVKKVKDLRQQGSTKFVHYVSPTVWAYKKERIYYMEKYYDLVLALFPFEPKYYEHTKVSCKYIGHPISEYDWTTRTTNNFRQQHGIHKNKDILGIMAGSRSSEVRRMLPIFIDAINEFLSKKERNVIVVFPVISEETREIITPFRDKMNFEYLIIKPSSLKEKTDMFKSFSKVIAKSGTSSLELVFANVPMIVAYKLNFFSYLLAKYWFRMEDNIKFVTMANLLLNKEIIPEYLQSECNSSNLCKAMQQLYDKDFCNKQLLQYKKVQQMLCNNTHLSPSKTAAINILKL